MFLSFFYGLKDVGIPVSPTAFLLFHRAMSEGLVASMVDLYVAARTILVKNEKYFDLYDRVFASVFEGAELVLPEEEEFALLVSGLLEEWLRNPKELAQALGADEEELARLSPEELLDYFKKRLRDQDGRHDGGSKWIGTGGTSPVGHGGRHPGGLRMGGRSRGQSAVKIAAERRYRDYAVEGGLTSRSLGEALRKIRHLVPQGPKDTLNIDATIRQTMKNGGEIELVLDRRIVDRLKIILAIDNGGWSMEPHIELVQTLFDSAKGQFRELQTYYFHNTIYDLLWADPGRVRKPVPLAELVRRDPETRLILVGDASMAPYELMSVDGSIYAFERSGQPSIDRLRLLAASFRHAVWLNPVPEQRWPYTRTIPMIGAIFPMFELSVDGLERAVGHLLRK